MRFINLHILKVSEIGRRLLTLVVAFPRFGDRNYHEMRPVLREETSFPNTVDVV